MSFQINLKHIIPIVIVSVLLAFTITETLKADAEQFNKTELSGFITDASTGEAVADAEVIILETGDIARSDSEGHFIFTELEAGSYTVEVSLEGYENYSETVEVSEEGTSIEISLKPSER
ncbi:MAG: carboxypeptidase regulatory-like domain-containing protein [Balneolaceae bacterium]